MLLAIKNWCRHSETIAWARVQAAAGFALLATVMAGVDLTPYLTGKGLIAYLILNSLLTELLRRKNTVVSTEVAPSGAEVVVLEKAHLPPELGGGPAGGDGGTSSSSGGE